ncbi:hypothetical protein OH687_27445 [Burkholderia anthina]|nr:hypothetical protein OH687_27445 [Burkholderia anthina]
MIGHSFENERGTTPHVAARLSVSQAARGNVRIISPHAIYAY